MPVIPGPGKPGQEHCKFETSLGYVVGRDTHATRCRKEHHTLETVKTKDQVEQIYRCKKDQMKPEAGTQLTAIAGLWAPQHKYNRGWLKSQAG